MIHFPPLTDRSSWNALKELILRGGVVALPVEYAYALSESPEYSAEHTFRYERNRRLFDLKLRNPGKPILYLAGSIAVVRRFANLPENPRTRKLLGNWPGFLTLVLPAKPLANHLGMSQNGGVAFRVPGPLLLRQFLCYLGTPLSGTSLNLSGKSPLGNPSEIVRTFPSLDGIVDGGTLPGHPASPVINVTRTPPVVIRTGMLKH